MERNILYNADHEVAKLLFDGVLVTSYIPVVPELLPMQIRNATADGSMARIHDRAIDLNTVLHRNMVNDLLGSRDKTILALMTHMFGISDNFACFREGEFIPRSDIRLPNDQACIARCIPVSSDTSLRGLKVATPDVFTDGIFPKTRKYENNDGGFVKINLPLRRAVRWKSVVCFKNADGLQPNMPTTDATGSISNAETLSEQMSSLSHIILSVSAFMG